MTKTAGDRCCPWCAAGAAPVLDVPATQVGRIEETFGEDPISLPEWRRIYTGTPGARYTDGVIATVKHFAGYGKSKPAQPRSSDIPAMLREVYLYRLKGVREPGTIGHERYQEIDGMPCTHRGNADADTS